MYNTGETIFYKLYVLSGLEWPSTSRNVYVSWYDNNGNYIKQTVAPLFQSSAKGSFEIPANYKGNFLRIKAYTRWMLNDDSVFLYEKYISINNILTSKIKNISTPKTRVDVFPEGGTFVEGLISKIAFKATNNFGTPVFIKGFLVNDKNKVLDTLKVLHDGMGFFKLRSKEGEKYQLNWTDENGIKGTSPIEAPSKEGVILKITMDNDKAYVQVEKTLDLPPNYKHMRLIVHQNQHLLYTVEFKGEERQVQKVALPIDELLTGVVQFTLFTNDWLPIAERIILVNNRLHEFNTNLNVGITNMNKRGKNVLEIIVKDTAATNMSISITDASVVMPEQQTIYSDFLLSSDIKGKVYNPAYYFTSDADSVTAHLDLVMLTNGWRRFDWAKMKAGILPTLNYARETELMKLKGKLYGAALAKSTENLLLNLIIQGKDSSNKMLFVPVAKDGSFVDKSVFFYDTSRVYYSINGKSKLENRTVVQFENGLIKPILTKIPLDPLGFQAYTTDSLARAKLNLFFVEQEKQRKLLASMTLAEVVVKSRIKTPIQLLEEKYATGLFSGGDGTSFDLTSDGMAIGAIDVLSFLQARVPGLSISVAGSQASATWRGSNTDFFVNEFSTPIEQIQNINIAEIAYIKALRPPFFGAVGGGGGGAIAIYTKRGGDNKGSNANSKGMENVVLGGYSVFKEFFHPDYDKPTANFEADNRTTLYWNPYVLTNKRSPRVRLEFYNNDISKKLQIVLEGMNANGRLTRVVKYIE
ncbi:MAG: hypothetical protein D4R91_04360 [Sediminibacterium sp.]|nr:MAG: hypothetical protein D4R91_04360 [Sediminibacterium sp.]